MEVLTGTHLFYASLTLFAISGLTLVLSIFFRLKHRRVNSLPKNLSANVFDKTFNVFNPYSEPERIIHGYFAQQLLTIIVNEAYLFLALFFIFFLQFGVLLSLVIILIWLNLVLLDHASETHQIAKSFVKAVHDKSGFGVGDLKVLQKLKRVMLRLSNYYLVLSILLLTLAVTLNYIWPILWWLFAQPIGLIFEASEGTRVISWQVVVLLYAAMVFIIIVLAWKIKGKVSNYILGSSSLENSKIQ